MLYNTVTTCSCNCNLQVSEVFTGEMLGVFKPWDTFLGKVNPTGNLFCFMLLCDAYKFYLLVTGILLLRFNVLPQETGDNIKDDEAIVEDYYDGGRRANPIRVRYPGLSGWRNEF